MSERAQNWQRLVAKWTRSGLSQAAFCRRHNLNYVTFGWWKRRLDRPLKERSRLARRKTCGSRNEDGQDKQATAVADFVEVSLTPPASAGYEVVLSGGRTIRLPHDFDPERVGRLVLTLESAC
jgi:hypothetical protein